MIIYLKLKLFCILPAYNLTVMNIGLAILQTREQFRMKQLELATKVGITPTSLSKIENGKQWPSHDNLVRIAAAMRVPVGLLYLRGIERNDFATHLQHRFDVLRPVLHTILEELR